MQEKNKKVVVPLTHSLSVWASARAIKFALGNDLYTGWTLTRFTHQRARNGSALFFLVFTSATNWNRDGRINRRALHWTRERFLFLFVFVSSQATKKKTWNWLHDNTTTTDYYSTQCMCVLIIISTTSTREREWKKRSIGRLLLLSLGFDACRRSKGSVETFEWMRK